LYSSNNHISFERLFEKAGKLKFVIGRSCSLEKIAEAHRYVEKGHKKGKYLMVGGSDKQIFQTMMLEPMLSNKGGKTFCMFPAMANQADLMFIKGLIEAGKIKPVIDRRYSLDKVPDAMQYIGEGHARAKIVITVQSHTQPSTSFTAV
jgi:NADPH:quinone reductase-like Zn-dependent oxidoreductase